MSKNLQLFLRANFFDFLLVLILALSVSYAVLSGFDASLALRSRFDIAIPLSAFFLLILYIGAWSRGFRVASIVGAVVYTICAIVVSLFLAPSEVSPFVEGGVNDVEGNYAIFTVVILVVSLLAYLLSRSRVGVVALALVTMLCLAAVQFLFRDWLYSEGGLFDFIVALIASVILVVYRRHIIKVTKIESVANPAFTTTFLMGALAAILSVGASALMFVFVINPLNLETPILKPFEHRIIPPIVEYTGAYDEFLVENPNEFTSLLNEREDATKENAKGGSVPDEEQTEASTNPLITFLQSLTIYSEDDWNEDFNPISTDRMRFLFLIFIALVILVIAAIVTLRIKWRDIRLWKIRNQPVKQQVTFLYDFLLSRLKRLKMGKPDTSTPLEFAFDSRRDLVPFTRGTDNVDFVRVTLVYQRAAYGMCEISEEDFSAVKRYYRLFFRNAHRQMGTLRWLWSFWRI